MNQFTLQDAARLLNKMKAFYGKKYADQWGDIDAQEIATAMVECYQGLTTEDFKRGVNRMMKSTFCPTVPEFRSWCEPKASDWLDAHEAWAIAKNSIEYGTGREMTVVWTEQAAKAFEKCTDLVATGDKFQLAEAKKIFVSIYDRLVTEAKDQGLKPVYNVSLGLDPDQRITAIKQAEVAGFLSTQETQLQLEHKQTKEEQQADNERYKTIAQKAIAELREKLKIQAPVNKMAEEIKEVQPWELKPDTDYWPDPFDQKDDFKKMLEADGLKMPMALRGAA
ncbi:hypothetical protein [Acinetobacter baumannii]|uniref:hypothetical protein n=1 Tax=Acinetobacter baumannii TaxID=470 RepID=UPI0011262B44|nr:hypothetical protein [Acinetobacter baumannii]EHU2133740.1 hypothetical protein [Acinetobacter baumannii]TPR75248.1 hypothetical protein FJU89_02890 [Acinetobacter baumannii]